MSVINKERVKQLLGSGLSVDIVATAVGCESSYISQLMGDDEFADSVAKLRAEFLLIDSIRDRNIGSIEDKLVTRLDMLVEQGMIMKPRDVLNAFAIINRAHRRGVSAPAGTVIKQQVVQITLPSTVMNKYITNKQGEIIDVDGQSLVAMPATQLLKELSRTAAEQSDGDGHENRYDKIRRFLPGS